MKNDLIWFFGRGASISCNLKWEMPDAWKNLEREKQIRAINEALPKEMDRKEIDSRPYKDLLSTLASKTSNTWRHYFITTNWDYLLQREIQRLSLTVLPSWLANSHVFHLNGTVESWGNQKRRSQLLLPTDEPSFRKASFESNQAMVYARDHNTFVVVGLSFSYDIDKTLLDVFSAMQDDCIIGNSSWVIIDYDKTSLANIVNQLKEIFPAATIKANEIDFGSWVANGMPELKEMMIVS